MTATRKVAKLIDVLSMDGEEIERGELMKRIGVTNLEYFQKLLYHARAEVGIYTVTLPSGYVGYKINYDGAARRY